MKTYLRLLFTVFASLPLAPQTVQGSNANLTRTKQEEATANKALHLLKEAIRTELQTQGSDEWPGEYHFGDGLGFNWSLLWSPKAGFTFESYGCTGTSEWDYGSVEYSNGGIHFYSKRSPSPTLKDGFECRILVPIKWGPRHYLVLPSSVVSFLKQPIGGGEPDPLPWGETALLKVGDYLLRGKNSNPTIAPVHKSPR